ncbi:FecR family protein [Sinomicrobium oceani]|uniref:FecR family protein n=1 Tax=Sinomicrobium oceani TaxID=1150368 RepID=UPI00227B470B|nr:FecR domain-containing protein [Sinomicrobium oceani]
MDPKLLEKYWQGKCSVTELKTIERFLLEHEPETDDVLQTEWTRSSARIPAAESEHIREAVFNPVKIHPVYAKRTFPGKSWLVAASLLILLSVGSLFYHFDFSGNEEWTIINNIRDTVKKIELNDGTEIWLKPGSSIRYTSTFGDRERHIKLRGEAYFDVARDTARPFRVQTGNITTKVLGTMFNIKAYEFEEKIQIVLTEGSVQVLWNDEKTEREIAQMRPGELLNFDRINNNAGISLIKNSGEDLYKGDQLIFHQATLKEALTRISRIHHLEIDMSTLSEADKEKHVSGVFHHTTPPDAIRRILFIHHMILEQKDGVFRIKKTD